MAMNPAEWMRSLSEYLRETQAELRKVTWPSQKEYVAGTIGVVVIVTLVTVILGISDFALGRIVQWVVP